MGGIFQLIVLIVIGGLIVWLVNTFLPIDARFKQLINVLVGIAVVLYVIAWLLGMAGMPVGLGRIQ